MRVRGDSEEDQDGWYRVSEVVAWAWREVRKLERVGRVWCGKDLAESMAAMRRESGPGGTRRGAPAILPGGVEERDEERSVGRLEP